MNGCAGAFTDGVSAVRILHERELLARFDKLVDEHLRALEMHLVIPCSMDQQEVVFKT